MANKFTLNINGKTQAVEAEPDTPLLYILRNDIELNGAKFGCGLGQCGACTVIVGGESVRSCQLPVAMVRDAEILTIEGLGTVAKPHPLQRAFIDEQAAQCGYCINGMIMTAEPCSRTIRGRAWPRSARRSLEISAAAARITASCARSRARRKR
jgi:nicotinate dehydrogenase subunit A